MTDGREIPAEMIRDAAREQIAHEWGFACYTEMQATLNQPRWLKARLERERASVLRAIGAESVDEARAALATVRDLREERNTANEALSEILTWLMRDLTPSEADAVCTSGDPLTVFRAIVALKKGK